MYTGRAPLIQSHSLARPVIRILAKTSKFEFKLQIRNHFELFLQIRTLFNLNFELH